MLLAPQIVRATALFVRTGLRVGRHLSVHLAWLAKLCMLHIRACLEKLVRVCNNVIELVLLIFILKPKRLHLLHLVVLHRTSAVGAKVLALYVFF